MDVFIFIVFCIETTVSSVDPDQKSQNVASELGLHCLHNYPKRGIWSKESYEMVVTLSRVDIILQY